MTSAVINPIINPQAWDFFTIGQKQSPGVLSSVTGWKRTSEFDKKKGKGTKGATMTYVGEPPAEGSFIIQLWRPIDFTEWALFLPLLKYDPTKKTVKAIDIYYPSLADININSVICEHIGAIIHEGRQLYTVTIEMIEYKPVPKSSAVSTADGSVSTQKKTTPGTPPKSADDEQQAEIARLMKKAAEP